MISDLIQRMRALDLLTTRLEGDDWCIAVDLVVGEAADVIEGLHVQLLNCYREAKYADPPIPPHKIIKRLA